MRGVGSGATGVPGAMPAIIAGKVAGARRGAGAARCLLGGGASRVAQLGIQWGGGGPCTERHGERRVGRGVPKRTRPPGIPKIHHTLAPSAAADRAQGSGRIPYAPVHELTSHGANLAPPRTKAPLAPPPAPRSASPRGHCRLHVHQILELPVQVADDGHGAVGGHFVLGHVGQRPKQRDLTAEHRLDEVLWRELSTGKRGEQVERD